MNNSKITIPVKKIRTFKFIVFDILTLGIYRFFWIWRVIKSINKMKCITTKKLNAFLSIFALFLAILLSIYNATLDTDSPIIYLVSDIIIPTIISYPFIKKIEEYALKTYNVKIKHSILALILFDVWYVNFAINDFKKRVKKAQQESNREKDYNNEVAEEEQLKMGDE